MSLLLPSSCGTLSDLFKARSEGEISQQEAIAALNVNAMVIGLAGASRPQIITRAAFDGQRLAPSASPFNFLVNLDRRP